MLKATDITAIRDGKTILQDLHLELRPGEVLGIIGKNGEGKSTLLNILAGLHKAQKGHITYDGEDLRSLTLTELRTRRAVLAQNFSLNFDITVYDILLMAKKRQGSLQARDFAAIDEMITMFNLEPFLTRSLLRLSGGELQRVLFAKTLLQLYPFSSRKTSYLFLDEPTSALDLELQQKILHHVRQITRLYNVGVLTILHDLNQATHYCDRLCLLSEKTIVLNDHPNAIVNEHNIEKYFKVKAHITYHMDSQRPILTI